MWPKHKSRRTKASGSAPNAPRGSSVGFDTMRSYDQLIHVSKLGLGMYVRELDRPWEDTSFITQGFYLNDWNQIKAVQDSCEYIYIDGSRKAWQSGGSNTKTELLEAV